MQANQLRRWGQPLPSTLIFSKALGPDAAKDAKSSSTCKVVRQRHKRNKRRTKKQKSRSPSRSRKLLTLITCMQAPSSKDGQSREPGGPARLMKALDIYSPCRCGAQPSESCKSSENLLQTSKAPAWLSAGIMRCLCCLSLGHIPR